jgi:hypothetical protein
MGTLHSSKGEFVYLCVSILFSWGMQSFTLISFRIRSEWCPGEVRRHREYCGGDYKQRSRIWCASTLATLMRHDMARSRERDWACFEAAGADTAQVQLLQYKSCVCIILHPVPDVPEICKASIAIQHRRVLERMERSSSSLLRLLSLLSLLSLLVPFPWQLQSPRGLSRSVRSETLWQTEQQTLGQTRCVFSFEHVEHCTYCTELHGLVPRMVFLSQQAMIHPRTLKTPLLKSLHCLDLNLAG